MSPATQTTPVTQASQRLDFRQGYLEDLASVGIADASIDIVVSNCVLNLSSGKEAALFRGNKASMLEVTRFGRHFRVTGNRSTHFGIFPCADHSSTIKETHVSHRTSIGDPVNLWFGLCEARTPSRRA